MGPVTEVVNYNEKEEQYMKFLNIKAMSRLAVLNKTKSEEDAAQFAKGTREASEKTGDEKPVCNKLVFLVTLIILCCVLLITIVLGCMLYFNSGNHPTAKFPQFLTAIGSTALGAIVVLLSSNKRNK